MSYTLVIVESPAKCSKIEKFLGPGYKCLASFGHLTKLSSLKNIDIENNFKLTFNIIDEKSNQIQKLQKAINNSSDVILATDDDREGEAIAWHICKLFKLSINNTKRILFNEITETAIKNSINNPSYLNLNVIYAQQTRQILDLLLGYRISPLLWKNISSNTNNSLSAGRCQTPALRLVYDNYLDLKDNQGKKVYNTIGYFTDKMFPFTLDKSLEDSEIVKSFLEKSTEFKHILSYEKPRDLKRDPPQPFTTSSLQQNASNILNFSPKITMQICQKLYEEGLITYMRTDSKIYSKEFIETAKILIKKSYNEDFINKNIDLLSNNNKGEKKTNKKKDNKNVQEAHEAIRPTNINITDIDKSFDSKEIRLYKLIWKNTIQSCMEPAYYKTITFKISAPIDLEYKFIGESCIFLGWQIVDNNNDENIKELAFNYLPTLKNKIVKYKSITCKVTIKDLKMHYTEARLVQLLEEKGIGRPSTFSSLIDKIQERNYVKKENIEGRSIICENFKLEKDNNKLIIDNEEKIFGNEKNKLVIQPIGIAVIEFLLKHCENLFKYRYTEDMENKLDLIAKGDLDWIDTCKNYNNEILDFVKPISKEVKKEEYKLDNNHTYIIGKYGPVIKYIEGDKTLFKSIKENLDHEKIKQGKYKLEDIIENENKSSGRLLGKYNEKDIYLKKGKYGLFIEYGDENKSVKSIKKKENLISLNDVIPLLENKIVREINENLSIRKGNYGDYIFYKTSTMKKPQFYKLNTFEDDYKKCSIETIKEWIKDKYNI